MSKSFTPADVARHNTSETGFYLIIDAVVYDVTGFLDEHPGGARILKRAAGKDASRQFWQFHNEAVLKKYGDRLKIGEVRDVAKL